MISVWSKKLLLGPRCEAVPFRTNCFRTDCKQKTRKQLPIQAPQQKLPTDCTMLAKATGAKFPAHKHHTREKVRRSLASVLSAVPLGPLP